MDLNQLAPVDFTPSTQSQEMNNMMTMSSFIPSYEQTSGEINVDGINYNGDLHLKHRLDLFWNQKFLDIQNNTDSKIKNPLPIARIKRVMKSDENVKLVSAETPVLFSKACEFLISELTLRAWHEAEEAHRRTLHRCDIANAIRKDDSLGFLVNTVPLDDHLKDDDKKVAEDCYHVNPPPPYPVLESNPVSGFVLDGPEAQQSMMMMTSTSSAPFHYGPPAKVMRPSESNNNNGKQVANWEDKTITGRELP